MAPTMKPSQLNARKNLVIEGLKGSNEDEMTANVLQIASDNRAIVYTSDIVNIFRMRRRDNTNQTPGPVLVPFNRILIWDNIMKRKANLRHIIG